MDTAHDHQTVTGEQFPTHQHNHHQSHGKNRASHQTGKADIGDGMHGNAAGRGSAGNEHTGKNAQQNYAQKGKLGFTLGGGHVCGNDLGRGGDGAVLRIHGNVSFSIKSVFIYREI